LPEEGCRQRGTDAGARAEFLPWYICCISASRSSGSEYLFICGSSSAFAPAKVRPLVRRNTAQLTARGSLSNDGFVQSPSAARGPSFHGAKAWRAGDKYRPLAQACGRVGAPVPQLLDAPGVTRLVTACRAGKGVRAVSRYVNKSSKNEIFVPGCNTRTGRAAHGSGTAIATRRRTRTAQRFRNPAKRCHPAGD
jgi:hypothetical protein